MTKEPRPFTRTSRKKYWGVLALDVTHEVFIKLVHALRLPRLHYQVAGLIPVSIPGNQPTQLRKRIL